VQRRGRIAAPMHKLQVGPGDVFGCLRGMSSAPVSGTVPDTIAGASPGLSSGRPRRPRPAAPHSTPPLPPATRYLPAAFDIRARLATGWRPL